MIEEKVQPEVQELESKEDLELLIRGDVVDTNRGLMRVFSYDECSELNIYGRGSGKSIIFITVHQKRIDVRKRKFVFKKPYKTTLIWNNGDTAGDYEFFNDKLQEVGL